MDGWLMANLRAMVGVGGYVKGIFEQGFYCSDVSKVS